ncbi:MAG: ATP-binding protein, partial [Acidimicrobiales bacterium]
LEDIIDNSAALIYVKDTEGRYQLINDHFLNRFGLEREATIGRTDHELFPADAAEIYRRHDARVLETGEAIEVEEPATDVLDGSWLSIKFAIADHSGRRYAVGGISTDITDRKRAEAAAREARDEAQRANAAKSEFLSRMSHELRTPLNAVLGFGQLLEMDDDLSAEQGEAVEHILRAGRHLLDLIDEVLDVSRIEAGELFLECEVVSAQAAFREALALIRPLAGESGVTIHDDALDDGPELYVAADRQRLLQVLLNLLSNAVKYNHPGGMVIASCDRLDDDTVRLVVSDSGSGIDLADLDRVFAPFDRVGAEQSNVEGTGIGLSLSLHLLEAMGGSIAVDSVVGVGSTFAIDLRQGSPRPATDLTTGPGSFDGAVGVGSAQEPRAWGPVAGRVLYIDDNVPNLDLVVGVLDRRGGVELETTDSGLAGLDLARTRRPDLVLLDLHLPDISGLEVLGRLRDDPVTRAIPVIMISADATMSSREELVAAGALEYLTKPIDVRRLLDRVDEVLAATLSGSEADR